MRFTDERFEDEFKDRGRLLVLVGENQEGRKEALKFLTTPVLKKKFPLQGEYTRWNATEGGKYLDILSLRDRILSRDFYIWQWGSAEHFVLNDTSPEQEDWLREHGAVVLRIEDAKAKGGPARPGEWVVPWKGTNKFAKIMKRILKTQKRF